MKDTSIRKEDIVQDNDDDTNLPTESEAPQET